MDEGGDGDISVGREGSGGEAFGEDVGEEGDDTASFGALGSTGTFIIVGLSAGARGG